MAKSDPLNIVVIGGSLGGLFTGIALKRLRHNVRIFERNPTPLLHDQGAGVVAGGDTQAFFSKYDLTNHPLAVTSRMRHYLDKDGGVLHEEHRQQQMTSWDLLYHLLRANFDHVESEYTSPALKQDGEGEVSYEYGCTVQGVEVKDPTQPVEISVQKHSGETFKTSADLLIAADGASSTLRSQFLPDVKRTYAGYVAWRGTVPESELSSSASLAFIEKFTFYHEKGVQILAYLIPGKAGTLEPGHRLLNWVWYCNYEEDSPDHIELMTDKEDNRHHVTLPPGGVKDDVWAKQKKVAEEVLPPQFAEIVEKTKVPFIQAITDVIAPQAVIENGRVLLVGDALAGFRPHTAASTSQAAYDAMTLAESLDADDWKGGLKRWEEEVMEYAKDVQRSGVQMGNRSQFGEHPLAGRK